MPVALDRIAYFGERLSENIVQTPEKYLICRNAVIGRSGFQTYKAGELLDPRGELSKLFAPTDDVQVWRDPAEVFSPGTIASFEGKPFTLSHPSQLLDPDNTSDHAEGHVQNVRRGPELPDGNVALIADIFVTGDRAIRAIESGERELSCGYTYQLTREGNRWDQRAIQGNHVALVQKGRAGDLARINDSAPEPTKPRRWSQTLIGAWPPDALLTLMGRDEADPQEKRQFTGLSGEKKITKGREAWEQHLPDDETQIHAWFHSFALENNLNESRERQHLGAKLRNFCMSYPIPTPAREVNQDILRELVRGIRTSEKSETAPRTMTAR